MANKHTPLDIKLHQKSKVLEVSFDDGSNFKLPCEYLRVYSPSAEVRGHGPGQGVLVKGKEHVNIDRIDPVGNYAVCLIFDDKHDTGIFAWDTLYELGANYQEYWNEYLERLQAAGYKRRVAE